jgi:nitronate monooxygenase
MWPDRRLLDLLKIKYPIVLAPMAGAMDFELIAAVVAEAGGLGSLPCAMLRPDLAREQMAKIRARTDAPINLNFFCHTPPELNNAREARWRERLKPYYQELGIDPAAPVPTSMRMPFDAAFCAMVEETRPAMVSFYFGLPAADLLARVRAKPRTDERVQNVISIDVRFRRGNRQPRPSRIPQVMNPRD